MEESKMVFYTSVPAFIEEIPRIPPEELKRMIDSGQPVVILDCNPEAVFRSEHIPGAVNLPRKFQGLGEDPNLPRNKIIVAYCFCEHEEDSGEAALEMITLFGYRNIKLLLGGNVGWNNLGYPMQREE
jgi:rhodanese-related sulfurtransferase